MKQRMLHSSSVGTVSSALKLSTVLQCNDLDDLDEEEITTRYVCHTQPPAMRCDGIDAGI